MPMRLVVAMFKASDQPRMPVISPCAQVSGVTFTGQPTRRIVFSA
jgi:hypothetical protein